MVRGKGILKTVVSCFASESSIEGFVVTTIVTTTLFNKATAFGFVVKISISKLAWSSETERRQPFPLQHSWLADTNHEGHGYTILHTRNTLLPCDPGGLSGKSHVHNYEAKKVLRHAVEQSQLDSRSGREVLFKRQTFSLKDLKIL